MDAQSTIFSTMRSSVFAPVPIVKNTRHKPLLSLRHPAKQALSLANRSARQATTVIPTAAARFLFALGF
jgi:hypothetical protein